MDGIETGFIFLFFLKIRDFRKRIKKINNHMKYRRAHSCSHSIRPCNLRVQIFIFVWGVRWYFHTHLHHNRPRVRSSSLCLRDKVSLSLLLLWPWMSGVEVEAVPRENKLGRTCLMLVWPWKYSVEEDCKIPPPSSASHCSPSRTRFASKSNRSIACALVLESDYIHMYIHNI